MRPPIPALTLSRRSKIALSVVGVLIVLGILLVKFAGVYVDWLWFSQAGFRSVYRHILWTRIVLFAVFGLIMAIIIGANLIVAYRIRPPFRPMSAEQQNIEHYRVMLEPRRKLMLASIMIVSFLAAGLSAQGQWEKWLLWLNGGSFGIKDPQFGRDIGFYAWDYPVYRAILSFGFTAMVFSVVLSVAIHYLSGAIRLQTPGPKITPAARRHLTILVFAFMIFKAAAYWLDRYGLVFSDRSKFTGASYTDVHSVLLSKTILFWIAIILALGVLGSLWMRSSLLPGIGFVVLMVLSVLISGLYPAIVQQVSVKPNASTKEAPYIARNIAATRQAYGIVTKTSDTPEGQVLQSSGGSVTYDKYSGAANPSTAVLQEPSATVDNLRILDPNVLSPTFSKFQQDGNVYGFPGKLDVDRYTVNGVTHDYIVAVRELDAANLNGNQTNWINQHTNYTHGYGFVAAQADSDVTNDGNVTGAFAAGGIPPRGVAPQLIPKIPQVYFGELLPAYSIVGAAGAPQEYDGNGTQKVTYAGAGGVSLGSLLTRAAFAIDYKQGNFLLNNAASANGAKIIFNRDPRTILQKVAPYLKVDSDPYPIVDQSSGHIVWMVDGYTTMNNFPYSERQSLSSLTNDSLSVTDKTVSQPNDSINYIRNSVKATVDAYTGKVTLYQWDQQDPVLKAWMKIFPGTVQPKSAMPQGIVDHVRYPEDLFEAQRAMLAQYHVDDPVVFYNVGDKWTVPNDPTTGDNANQPPYYVLASPPIGGSAAASFQLTSPMNVNNSTYLAAFITADSDPANYGAITVLRLPQGSSAVQGPEQVFSKLSSNATITKDLSLFNTAGGGSTVIHGNLLTLPIGNSFLYVEPLYTQSTGGGSGSYPQLQRIIAVYGDRIGYGATLSNAISDFLPEHTTGQTLPGGSAATNPSTSPSSPTDTASPGPGNSTVPNVPATQQALLDQMNAAYGSLQAATRSGDFARIGAAQQRFNTLVSEFLTKYGTAPASSPAAQTGPVTSPAVGSSTPSKPSSTPTK